jgi:hypothetical protein
LHLVCILAGLYVCMVPPTVEDVHMASPILTSQLPTMSEIALFLPPLEIKTEPIVFPPFNIHAVPRQALEPLAGPRKIKAVPLDDSPYVYIPAVSSYLAEPPTMFSASCQGDNYTSAVHNHFFPNSVYRPVTPSPSKLRTILRDVPPILIPVKPTDILDEEGQIADTRAETPSPLIESTSCAGRPDGIAGPGDIAPNVDCIPWPDSIDEQDATMLSTPHLVAETYTPEWIDEEDVIPSTPPHFVAETYTPEWIDEQNFTFSTPRPVVTDIPEWTADEDVTSLCHPILQTTTPFHCSEITFSQEFVDRGADLIDLWSPNLECSNFDKDESESVLHAFGVSNLKDLDGILEGVCTTSVADACIESMSASNRFEAMFVPDPLSPVSPCDWAVSEVGLDLISFDGLHHNIHSGSSSIESGDVIQFETNGLFQTSTPAPYNRSASPDVQSCPAFDPLDFFNKPTFTDERNPRSTKRDASTQTEESPGATYGTSF